MTDYITTKDFIREVEKLGFTHEEGAFCLYIEDNGCTIANVSLDQPFQMDTSYESLNYKNPTHISLYELIDRYARTPLDKRVANKCRQSAVNEYSRGENEN